VLKLLVEYLYPCNKNSITWVCLLIPKKNFLLKVVEFELNPGTSIILRCRIDLRIFKKLLNFM